MYSLFLDKVNISTPCKRTTSMARALAHPALWPWESWTFTASQAKKLSTMKWPTLRPKKRTHPLSPWPKIAVLAQIHAVPWNSLGTQVRPRRFPRRAKATSPRRGKSQPKRPPDRCHRPKWDILDRTRGCRRSNRRPAK